MEKERRSFISQEEYDFINATKGGTLYVNGLLLHMKEEGVTLKEAYEKAITKPDQEEHIPAYTRARDFLLEHAKTFGLETDAKVSRQEN